MQKFFFKNNECKQIKSEGHFRKINLIFIKLWKFTLSFWEKNGGKSPSKYKYSVLCSKQFQSKNARKNRKNLKLWMTYIFWKTFGAKRKRFFDVPAKKNKAPIFEQICDKDGGYYLSRLHFLMSVRSLLWRHWYQQWHWCANITRQFLLASPPLCFSQSNFHQLLQFFLKSSFDWIELESRAKLATDDWKPARIIFYINKIR